MISAANPLKITMKKSSLESVRQIPAKASVVRQPKKVYYEMIGMANIYMEIKTITSSSYQLWIMTTV
jgi:hypothetical protein